MSRYSTPGYGPGTFVNQVCECDMLASAEDIAELNARLKRDGRPTIRPEKAARMTQGECRDLRSCLARYETRGRRCVTSAPSDAGAVSTTQTASMSTHHYMYRETDAQGRSSTTALVMVEHAVDGF